MLVQSCLQLTANSILKAKGNIKLLPSSISVIEVRTLEIPDPSNIYELDSSMFQLPRGVNSRDAMHHMDHKMPQTLKVPILNTNNTISSLGKNSPIATLVPAGKFEQIQGIERWEVTLELDLLKKPQLLPEIPSTTNLQLEPNTTNVSKSIPDANIPKIARKRLQQLLDVKYNSIVSKSAADIGRTNLIELDIPTEGPPMASKPYTVPLKYWEFVEHEIKQLEEEGSSPEAWVTGQAQSLSSQRMRSEQGIPVHHELPQVLIITNLILDYALITENSIATSW